MGSGARKPLSKRRKKPTAAQLAARIANLPQNKENIPPPPIPCQKSLPPKNWKHEYEKLQRRFRESKKRQAKLEADLAALKVTDAGTKRTAHLAEQRIKELSAVIEKFVLEGQKKSAAAVETVGTLRKQVKALKQRVRRSIRSLSRTVARAKQKWSVCRVTEKGIYTAHARKIARIMADGGCARGKIGPMMERIANVFGVRINRTMSRRTVGRAIEEGGVAARMQIIYELSQNTGVTISANSTSNRGQNIESRHLATRAPDYKSGNLEIDPHATPKVRFLGVEKTLDHSSAQSVEGWKNRIGDAVDIFNRSPFAARLRKQYSVREFLVIVKGMNGDHASSEKGTAKGIEALKREATLETLGEQALAGKAFMELVDYLAAWNAKKIADAGGEEGWKVLSPAEQTDRDAKLMAEIVAVLGKEAYNALSPEDRRALDLFIWGGCCMHKDLNSFKGGNTEMMLEWKKIGAVQPVLLANKANTAILRNVYDCTCSPTATLTEDEFKAFEASTCGGVKACALAGAIFNNKDKAKKGQGDKHVDFMTKKTGKQHHKFPDTNNTRFGSHGDAAAELITYLPEYLEMLDVIRWTKTFPSLTNIEKNLLAALQDPPTLAELVAMTLYRVLITHPYMRQVRGPGTENTNLLDLGPLHKAVQDHIKLLLEEPDLIFGSEVSYETATLDGKKWSDPAAMEAAFKLIPTLPHVQEVTLAFLRGALVTFTRFSAEFAPGGLIDTCSATEKEQAWMPSTNDANEGGLGAYTVTVQGKPTLTLHQYNAQAMFRRNDTQDFMDATFTAEDHAYIMREARRIDASGEEAKMRARIVDFRLKTAAMQKDKALAKIRRAKELLKANLERELVPLAQMPTLTVPKIVDQLNSYRARGVPNILAISKYKLKADKLAALEKAFEWYQLNGTLPSVPESTPVDIAPVPEVVDDWEVEEDAEMEE
ncbi:hypothetical protein C8F04DRAFT_1314480 [Mycena alexandri]|uniref:Uncharacterized protein n=1 Tax=Mycena alexandri TaxID=1745969 RepID=A0AAD6S5A3_9AGAR|nr:hypothetical protein C8F04DRAFT_1314480 [Mycena alexandri]